MWNKDEILKDFEKIVELMQLKEWNLKLEFIEKDWKNTGNIKIDMDIKTAIVYLNIFNPKQENYEQVLIHELCHLKLWKLDQLCESLIDNNYEKNSKDYNFAYDMFMNALEATTEEIAKSYLNMIGKNKKLSFNRCEETMPFRE